LLAASLGDWHGDHSESARVDQWRDEKLEPAGYGSVKRHPRKPFDMMLQNSEGAHTRSIIWHDG